MCTVFMRPSSPINLPLLNDMRGCVGGARARVNGRPRQRNRAAKFHPRRRCGNNFGYEVAPFVYHPFANPPPVSWREFHRLLGRKHRDRAVGDPKTSIYTPRRIPVTLDPWLFRSQDREIFEEDENTVSRRIPVNGCVNVERRFRHVTMSF